MASDVPASARQKLTHCRLYVLLTASLCRVPLREAARMVLRGGADIIQLREKEATDREIFAMACDLRGMAHEAGALFIVNDRADIARLAGADGVHLGQTDLPPAAARAVLGSDGIIGVSTHSVEQARRAVADGADYIGVGPMFPTATKGYTEGVGPRYVREAASVAELPLVAIGGITPERVSDIMAAVPERHLIIAVSSAILNAPDIESATRRFLQAIQMLGFTKDQSATDSEDGDVREWGRP